MPAKSTSLLKKAFGEQITDDLRDALVRGEFSPGERITEEDVAARYSVSRGPVREAFRQLAVERLVRSSRSGTYVIGVGEEDIAELYLLRKAIETLAATLAMDRTSPNGWGEMEQTVRALEEAADRNDEVTFAAEDIHFHSLIYKLSGHQRLNDVWHQYSPILMRLLQETIIDRGDLHPVAQKHRLLLDLLKAKDETAVTEELHSHLEDSRKRLVATLRQTAATRTASPTVA